MRKAILGLAMTLAACSSEVDATNHEPVTSPDSGSTGGAPGSHHDATAPKPDASPPKKDASHPPPTEAGRADAANPKNDGGQEGGIKCEAIAGPAPDFSITLTQNVRYAGTVTIESADAGATALVARFEGGEIRTAFGGRVPALTFGSTLWASLEQVTTHANPYHSATTTAIQVRASEHGAVVAEAQETYAQPGSMTFLDTNVELTRLCSTTYTWNNAPCLTTTLYSVTVHGDSDLILTPASEGKVMIHGVEYDIWLGGASDESMSFSVPSCISDWGPHPGLRISGRAVRYSDVLKAEPRDAGSDH